MYTDEINKLTADNVVTITFTGTGTLNFDYNLWGSDDDTNIRVLITDDGTTIYSEYLELDTPDYGDVGDEMSLDVSGKIVIKITLESGVYHGGAEVGFEFVENTGTATVLKPVTSYTFSNINTNHTLKAKFAKK